MSYELSDFFHHEVPSEELKDDRKVILKIEFKFSFDTDYTYEARVQKLTCLRGSNFDLESFQVLSKDIWDDINIEMKRLVEESIDMALSEWRELDYEEPLEYNEGA